MVNLCLCVVICVIGTTLCLLEPLKGTNGEADVNNVADHVALLEQNLKDLTNRYEATAAELAALKTSSGGGAQSLASSEISFEINLQNDVNGTLDSDILMYDNLLYNTGAAYDKNQGIFTAPLAGSYLFWCYVVVNDKDSLQVNLNVNGKVMASGFAPHHRQYRLATVTTLLQLNQGDKVWMTKQGSVSIRGGGLSSFGGVLLYKHRGQKLLIQ